jgi:hypothetical protein
MMFGRLRRGRLWIEPFIGLIADLEFGTQFTKLIHALRDIQVVRRLSLSVMRNWTDSGHGNSVFQMLTITVT